MNIELQRAKVEDKQEKSSGSKEAKENKEKGDSEIKTSCICCKFKPNCLNAVPYYIKAADLYHASSQWNEELYCREKLVFCHQNLKSHWEEGFEHQKMAFLYLNQLNNKEKAFKSIQNSYQAYFTKAEYKDAIEALSKLAKSYYDQNDLDYSERCLKIAYDSLLQVFHTLASQKDEPYEFMYGSLDQYLSVLFKNDKVRLAIESCENVIKVVDPYEEDKSRVAHIYGFMLLGLIINEDELKFKDTAESAKNVCTKYSDRKFIENIEQLYESIQDCKENKYRDYMIEINVEYPAEVGKKLNNLILDRLQKRKSVVNGPTHDDQHVVIVNEKNEDYL